MPQEIFKPYEERVATVVGGRGGIGSKTTRALESLGFQSVQICEQGDPFRDFVGRSTDVFFAVDDREITAMLQASRDLWRPDHSILDGASVKPPTLITAYRELDNLQISVCSTHLGAVPAQPWRGVKVWVCEVGENSKRAKRLAFDMYLSTNSSIQAIDIGEHRNVERDQWITMASAYVVADALRVLGYPLEEFDRFATLSSEHEANAVGRVLGQGTRTPGEILYTQPQREELLGALEIGLANFRKALMTDREALQAFMQGDINFHNGQKFVDRIFRRAGIIGARSANLRMHSLSFRITDDRAGKLRDLLVPFYDEGVNLTAIDSMPGIASEDELQRGVDPDKIVDFDTGIDPKTITPAKEERIKSGLVALGCTIT